MLLTSFKTSTAAASLLLILNTSQSLHAHSETTTHANFQNGFYVGAATGWSHLSGKRKDILINAAGEPEEFTQNQKISSDSVQSYVSAGYFYRLFDSRFVSAFEPFVGYGSFTHESKRVTREEDGATPGLYYGSRHTSTLKRSWSWGALAKIGATFNDRYFIYGLIGGESSQFQRKYLNEFSVLLKQNKNIWSSAYGIGVEMAYYKVRFGVELKHNIYKRTSISQVNKVILTPNDRETYTLKFKARTSAVLARVSVPLNLF